MFNLVLAAAAAAADDDGDDAQNGVYFYVSFIDLSVMVKSFEKHSFNIRAKICLSCWYFHNLFI